MQPNLQVVAKIEIGVLPNGKVVWQTQGPLVGLAVLGALEGAKLQMRERFNEIEQSAIEAPPPGFDPGRIVPARQAG